MAILISDKVDFRAKKFTIVEGIHYIVIKESVHQGEITVLNVYIHLHIQQSCKISETKYDRIEREIDKFTAVVEDFKTPLSTVDKTTRKEISNCVEELNDIINQQNLINTHRIFHSTRINSSKIDHILCHKTHLIKFKRT